MIRDHYYSCCDCHVGEKMTGDGYPYKFVTLYENEEYVCFLQVDDYIKEMLAQFLQIILGVKFSSSHNYGANIMYAGKIQPRVTKIKNIFQTKKDDNV